MTLRRTIAAAGAACALLCALAAPTRAQTPEPLTLARAIAIARAEGPAVLSGRASRLAARNAQTYARIDELPEVSLSSALGARQGLGFDETTGQLVNELNWSGSVSVNVSYRPALLLTQSSRRAALRLSRLSAMNRATWDIEAAALSVADLYFAWAEADGQRAVAAYGAQAARLTARLAADLVAAGLRPAADLDVQLSNVVQADVVVAQVAEASRVAESSLITILGLDPNVARRPERLAPASTPLCTREDYQKLATRRLDIRAAETARQAAQATVETARWASLPELSLSIGGGSSFSSASEEPVLDQLGASNVAQRAGLSLSVPLLGSSRARRERGEAAVGLALAEADEARVLREVERSVAEAFVRADASDAGVGLARQAAAVAGQASAYQQRSYERGQTDLVDFLRAQAALVQATSELVAARTGAAHARTRLHLLSGATDSRSACAPSQRTHH